MESVLKAEFSYFTDYYFTDDGVLRIELISYARFAVLAVILVAAVAVLFGLLLGVPLAIIVFLGTRMVGHNRRSRLSLLPASELSRLASSTLTPWSDVTSVSLRGRNITILTTGAKRYNARVAPYDLYAVKQFLGVRLGERLNVREG